MPQNEEQRPTATGNNAVENSHVIDNSPVVPAPQTACSQDAPKIHTADDWGSIVRKSIQDHGALACGCRAVDSDPDRCQACGALFMRCRAHRPSKCRFCVRLEDVASGSAALRQEAERRYRAAAEATPAVSA
jgi:hypothetical protein